MFDRCTTKICTSKSYTTISLCIFLYNLLMKKLENFCKNQHLKTSTPDLWYRTKAAYNKLRKYYFRTDYSPVYSVTTAVHPTYYYNYWTKNPGWKDFVEPAKNAVHSVWKVYNPVQLNNGPTEGTSFTSNDNSDNNNNNSDDSDEDNGYNINKAILHEARAMALLMNTTISDELKRFATAPIDVFNPLDWWRLHGGSWLGVVRMVHDYFGIMVMSAPSEQAFSRVCTLLHYQRN